MRKYRISIILLLLLVLVVACSKKDDSSMDEVAMLDVQFEVPETAKVGEPVELKATVTYGEELVKDADELSFEIWITDDRDNGEHIDAENNDDGTYTLQYTFEEATTYEMYAHTTARGMHVMPLKKVEVTE